MNFQEYFTQILSLLGTFNLKVGGFLFLICFLGDALHIFVPYLLETTWIMTGYLFISGEMSFPVLMFLVVSALLGRIAGTFFLYGLVRSGNSLFMRFKDRFKWKTDLSSAPPIKLFRKINLSSPFWVAAGRLLWLRIPLTFVMAAQGRWKVLLPAVVLSGLVYEFTYIVMGAIVGTTTKLEPLRMLVYSLTGLTVLYGITFGTRLLLRHLVNKRRHNGNEPVL
ncbi:MAG: hypothetical protein ABIH70_08155 [Chloroflexota bacterium]